MNVLSLCDGMSCGHIALDRAGIPVDNYYAAEIKDIAIKVTRYNYPSTLHIGDINKIHYNKISETKGELIIDNKPYIINNIDLVIFGSPCQSFSIAMRKEHRIGLEDKEKSGLFLECYRILKEVNPKYFLMENVASMKKEDKDFITSLMGVEPIKINSALVSACNRNRLYWTNIPGASAPADTNISLQNILTEGYTNKEKGTCLLVSDSRPLTTPVKMFYRYYVKGFTNLIFKNKEHFEECCNYFNEHYKGLVAKQIPTDKNIEVFKGLRYLNQIELERIQNLPEGYTKCLTRNQAADVCGDGWTIDVITHIFRGLK